MVGLGWGSRGVHRAMYAGVNNLMLVVHAVYVLSFLGIFLTFMSQSLFCHCSR